MRIIHIIIFSCLAIISIFLCFYKLGDRPLERWDEQTNATVITELHNSSSNWDLTYNHKPFFEKPPLWYWITKGITQIFGMNSFSLRLLSALSGIGIITVVYLIANYLYSKTAAIYSITILLSTGQLFVNNVGGYFATHNLRSADLDALQLFLIMLSYLFMMFTEYKSKKYFSLFVICISLAFITKGQLSLVGVIVWVIYKIITKRKIKITLLDSFITVACGLIIIAPWYYHMIHKYGQIFIYDHFIYHLISRVSTPLEGHSENIFFYTIRLFNPAIFPYFIPLIFGIIYILIMKKYYDFKYFFPTFSVIVIFVIINITQTKLTWYLLSIYPFAALIIGGLSSEINNYLSKSGKLIFNILFLIYSLWGIINNFGSIIR